MIRPARSRTAGRRPDIPPLDAPPAPRLRAARPLAVPLLLALLLIAGAASAQTDAGADGGTLAAASYPLFEVEGSGVDGTLQLTARAEGGTQALVTLPGNDEGARRAVGLFEGDCGPDRPLLASLGVVGDLPADPFVARMPLETGIDEIVSSDLFAYVFAGPDLEGPVVACGEVGEGAVAPAGGAAAPGATGAADRTERAGATTAAGAGAAADATRNATTDVAAGAAPADPQSPLRSVSYGVFAVDGSGIAGQLQATERVEGGTRLLLTLQGIDAGDRHGAALFRGDCGPDRERVLELPPVGEGVPDDPFATELVAPLAFGEVADRDLFVYVYAGPEAGGEVVACGEVGVGANR